ncbi:hypothetical protein FB451DRAFT_1374025 [Mycena latifolia]|nr:hypothetical protein FB451DRAFT_1374025 [Mycena latifolia]
MLQATNVRAGSGPKKAVVEDTSASDSADESPDKTSNLPVRRPIRPTGPQDHLHPLFRPRTTGQPEPEISSSRKRSLSEVSISEDESDPRVLDDPDFVKNHLLELKACKQQILHDVSMADLEDSPALPPPFFSNAGLDEDDIPGQLPDENSDDTPSMESTVVPDGVIKSYLSALKDQFDREIRFSTKPNCYQNGTFWVHPRDPYFSLEKSGRTETGVTPSSLYLPSVFLWLPDCLHTGELKCSNPVCQKARTGVALSPKGWNDNPIARRVVGLDRVYYVMTKRVQCARAGNGCGKSWNLYDPNIMEQLDPGLAASFPAFLTHRSGIDKSVMTLIRAGMANSMNSNSWAKVLRELHIREKDLRELQYLYAIMRERAGIKHPDKAYEPFSDFEDQSEYAGFSPHRNYITAVYVDYMNHIRAALDQCLSALKCTKAKWDHSHKLTKFLMKLGGVTIFAGLFTLINEAEQIRYQAFVPTKSLAHICSDNVANDAATFLDCIPTLGEKIDHTQIEDFSDLPLMLLPDNVLVNVCSTDIEIASACNAILAHIVNDSVECHVGFDMEWEYSGSEFSRTSKKTSLIQIAFQTSVFLMSTHLLKTLPSSLLTVITSLQIMKVGRNIGGDLAKLARDFPEYKLPAKVNGQLPGVIELGAFAKAKNAIQKGTASLSAITAAVLHVNLSKEARDSPWDAPSLSSTQINCAALDAWVCLDIWQTLKDWPVGQPVSVYLWRQEVAQGILVTQPRQFPIVSGSENQEKVMISVSTTRTRALVEIHNVIAPKCILTHHKKTLEELKGDNTSFMAVVNLSSLKTRSLEPSPPAFGGPREVTGDVALIHPPSLDSLEQSAATNDSPENEKRHNLGS